MALVEGTGVQLAYNKETSWAVPNGTAYTVVRKLTGAGLNEERSQLQSAELNNRRAVTGMRLGTRKTRATVPFELFYAGAAAAASQQFDDFMESWMCAAWTAASTAASFTTFAMAAPSAGLTVVTAGTPGGTVLAATDVGKWYKLVGTTATTLNGFYRLVAFSSTTSFTLAAGQALPSGAAQGSTTLTPMAYVVPGTTTKSIAFDEAYTDQAAAITLDKMAIGAVADTFSLSITPDQIITGEFGFQGRVLGIGATRALAATNASLYSTIAAAASWPAAATSSPMTANDSLTYLMVDNQTVGVITNFTLNGANGLEELFPVGATCPYGIGKGISNLSGTFDIYLTDSTFWTAYRAETTYGITLRLMDPDTAVGYAIDIPNVKLSGLGDTKDQTKVLQNVQWMALENAAVSAKGGITVNMRVSRLTA